MNGGNESVPSAPQSNNGGGNDDLFGMFGGDGGGGNEGQQNNLQLVDGATLSQAEFQSAWMNPVATSNAVVFDLQLGPTPALPALEQSLRNNKIQTLASGVVNGNIKAYFFGQNTQSVTFLCELVSDSAGNSRGTCKTSNGQDSHTSEFVDLMKSALSNGGNSNSSSTSSAADDIMSLF
jgi:hypothetical protein